MDFIHISCDGEVLDDSVCAPAQDADIGTNATECMDAGYDTAQTLHADVGAMDTYPGQSPPQHAPPSPPPCTPQTRTQLRSVASGSGSVPAPPPPPRKRPRLNRSAPVDFADPAVQAMLAEIAMMRAMNELDADDLDFEIEIDTDDADALG